MQRDSSFWLKMNTNNLLFFVFFISWDEDHKFFYLFRKSRDKWTENWWQEGDAITVRVRKAIATYDFEG
jgi:hypothetical protein